MSVNTTECIICYNEYDTEFRKPCIGTCGHSICEECKHRMISSKCPQCNREEAFAITTINYQVLELIKHFKSMQGCGSSSSATTSNNIDEGVCSVCTLHSKKLRLCIVCALNAGILRHDSKKNAFVLVSDNGGVDAAIEEAKKMAICGDCALDGVQHEGHKTMQLAAFKVNEEDGVTQAVEEKLDILERNYKATCKELEKVFDRSIELMKSYFAQYNNLPTDQRKIHFNNIENQNEKINDTIFMVNDAIKRLNVINNEVEEHSNIVKLGKRAVVKGSIIFANMEPVLIADRKQSAREPLLIGVFNPKDKLWTPVGRMPNPKSNYAVATYKKQIYIVGGMNNGSWLNNVEMYDREKNLRRDCNRMKKGRTRTSAGFHFNKLYVAGGYDSTYMNSVEIYDPDRGEWRDGPLLQKARADAAVVPCNGELYVLGGFNGKDYEEKIEKMSESMQKFEVVGDMQGSRAGFGSCSFRGRIYIAGGWSNSSNTLKSVRSYDTIAKSWRDEPSLNKDRKYFTLHATSEAIYAIRGCADSWSLINEVERFDPETQKWDIISCSGIIPPGVHHGGNEQHTGS